VNGVALLREVGLLPDGPVVWGRPVPARGPGVFVVELPGPLARAPIELTRAGKWIERVPTLTLDGARPTSKALAARMASFWLPSQVVLYVASTTSIGARVSALERTVLGDRRPHAGGHWLHTLDVMPTTRLWWAETDAPEEYEDALLGAFAAGIPTAELAALPDRDVVLPFANLRRPTGERRTSGLAGSLLSEVVEPAPPPTRVVVLPDGDAEGARGEPPEQSRARGSRRGTTTAKWPASKRSGTGGAAGATPVTLTADGAGRLRAELTELVEVRRPEVVARIRAAKELGDLKENADYHAAREEQSFLEGRIQALEARLRGAVVAPTPVAGAGADIGSRVTLEVDGETATYTLVGSAEADASAKRLSVASPVGRALVGAQAGDEVTVETPRGPASYRVVALE
jgi:transcription elongation factor GreA